MRPAIVVVPPRMLVRAIAGTLASLITLAAAGVAVAQPFPAKPIRIINAFSPGGSSDTIARTIGQPMGERLGQPVVVESRTGAGGNIGADHVAKSAPDGYTLLMGTATFPVAAVLNRKMPFDVVRDLAPVTLIGGTAMVLVAHPDLPAKTLAELVTLAKAKPGDLAYASPGNGTLNHLEMELIAGRMGMQLRHVPYRSNPLAMNDVLAGHVPLLLDFITTGAPHVRSGKVRALATTGAARAPQLPDTPTMAEAGLAGYESRAWFGVFAPGGTPRPVVDRLDAEIRSALALPAVRERLGALGVELTVAGPDAFAAVVKSDIEKWKAVVAKAGIAPID